MPYGFSDTFELTDLPTEKPGWQKNVSIQMDKPTFADTDENKRLFGIELARDHKNEFEAAAVLFDDTVVALWVSKNWLNDPTVIAARDVYLKTYEKTQPILDKEQLAARLLKIAEEFITDTNGIKRYINATEDRLKALRHYSDIAGYTGKTTVDLSKNTFLHNELKVVYVDAQKKDLKTVDVTPTAKPIQAPITDLKIKLVG